MNKYTYLMMKKEEYEKMAQTTKDRKLKVFYLERAESFEKQAMALTVYEGLEEMK